MLSSFKPFFGPGFYRDVVARVGFEPRIPYAFHFGAGFEPLGHFHGVAAVLLDAQVDPLFLVVKGMQDKQMEVLEAIKMFSDMGLNSTGGLSNNSNGMPKHIRPIMDSALVAMAMMNGLTSAIVNPNDLRLMETIKSCDVFKGNTLYADSYLEI